MSFCLDVYAGDSRKRAISQYLYNYFTSGWNVIDSVSILTFVATFVGHVVYSLYYSPDFPIDGDCPLKDRIISSLKTYFRF